MEEKRPLKVLLVEADERIAELTARYLRSQDMEVDIAPEGLTPPIAERSVRYDCIVLGLNHPGPERRPVDRRVAGRLRIVAFAADEAEIDSAEIPKPCSLRELLRRIRAVTA